MSFLDKHMLLAKKAIKYVNKLDITSINVPFRLTSYHGSPLSKFDMFLFCYMRTESVDSDEVILRHTDDLVYSQEKHTGQKLSPQGRSDLQDFVTQQIQGGKSVRMQINQIMQSTASKSEKKKQLTELMNKTGFNANTFHLLWHKSQTKHADEPRIRAARRAIKFRHGNCGEKSAIAATWLIENTKNTKRIFWVAARNWDHAWVVMGDTNLSEDIVATGKLKTWPKDVVVADGWTGDWYPIHHHIDPFKGTPANPFQMYVRGKVQEALGAIAIQEEVKWPPRFSPAFTLELAQKGAISYARPSQRARMKEILDNPTEFNDAYEDVTE